MEKPLRHRENIYSEDFRSFISTTPPAIVRNGSFALFIIVFGLLSLTYFIKYSDTIPVKAEVSSLNYPKAINSKVQGRLLKILKKDGDIIHKGDNIAYIESNADYNEIINLSTILNKYNEDYTIFKEGISNSNYKNLGDIQQRFDALRSLMKDNTTEEVLKKRLNVNKNEILINKKLDLNSINDSKIANEELRIAHEDYNKRKILFNKGVISNFELQQSEAQYLAKKHPISAIKANSYSYDKQRLSLDKEIIDGKKAINDYNLLIKSTINDLNNSLNIWMKTYVLSAPSEGTLRYRKLVQEDDYINPNDSYFYIEPINNSYSVTIEIPQKKFGKVSIGQTVNIKLDGYPYEEFGVVLGKITYISKISNLNNQEGISYYLAQVNELSKTTKNGKTILLTNGMTGTGEIVATKDRLIYHLINKAVRLTN